MSKEISQIFVSYAHADNRVVEHDSKGWVTFFYLALENELIQRGLLDLQLWRDKREIDPSELFGPEIEDGLKKSRLLISILSPVYIQKEWCLKELNGFVEFARTRGRFSPELIIKVIKRAVALDQEPEPLRGREGYKFFEYDAETRREIPYYHPDRQQPRDQYWDILGVLADDIKRRLEEAQSAPDHVPETAFVTPSPPAKQEPALATVYLARTSADLSDEYRKLRGELEARHIRVVPDPDRYLPNTLNDALTVIRSALDEAQLSIHLLGHTPGFVPDGTDQAIVPLQLEAASAKAQQNERFQRLIWLPPGLQPDSTSQQQLIADLRNGHALLDDDELIAEPLEQLKTLIFDRLRRLDDSTRTQEPAAPGYPPQIYILCEPADSEAVYRLSDLLFDAGCETLLPDFSGEPAQREQFHRECLKYCDMLILYYGHGDRPWLRKHLWDSRNWQALGRQTPISRRVIVLAAPASAEKRHFRTRDADLVLDAIDALAPATLQPLLDALQASSTPATKH